MLPKEKMRRMEVLVGNVWVPCDDMGRIEAGDRFRMYEPDGRPVSGPDDPNTPAEYTALEQTSVRTGAVMPIPPAEPPPTPPVLVGVQVGDEVVVFAPASPLANVDKVNGLFEDNG